MPNRHDWARLARETFHAVDRQDVADLYKVEWRDAAEALMGDEARSIEAERSSLRRFLRKANAVLYGLTRKLAPARRLLFALALLFLVLGQIVWVREGHRDESGAVVTVDLHAVGFLILTFLLGMELVDKIQFRSELEMARDLQADLLPRVLPRVPGFDLGAHNKIANTVGGDLYDVEPLPDGGMAVLFGDASGHGMTAGLVMAVTHAAFRAQLPVDPSPESVMATINRLLCRSGACRTSGPRQFFAGVALLLSPDGAFRAIVAGHPPVLRVSASGEVVGRVGSGSYPAGVREATGWNEERGVLAPGETLLFYSDGLYENRDAYGREFGEDRVLAVVRRKAGATAEALVAGLASEASLFLGRRPPEDDVSILAIRRALPGEAAAPVGASCARAGCA